MTGGNTSVTNCTSHASVTASQSYAGGVVGMLTNGSVTGCIYLGKCSVLCFLLGDNSGLKEEDINYGLAVNGREFKARKNDDGTWKKWAYAVCVPFDMEIPDEQKDS